MNSDCSTLKQKLQKKFTLPGFLEFLEFINNTLDLAFLVKRKMQINEREN